MSDANIVWKPTPKQAEFLSCPAREALLGGSVGGGKTDVLLMCAASQTGNPKHRALFLRRTFPMLRDVVARSHELFLPLGATFKQQTSQWTFPSNAVVELGFLDADEDRYRYMGRAFSCICWDELTSWRNDGNYVYLLSRLRATETSGLRLEIRSTCTPGGQGHFWVQDRFGIPPDGSASEVVDPETGYRRCFIPARISDNPHLRGGEYERSLRALPEPEQKSLLLGRWDSLSGQIFLEFSAAHVCPVFTIPDHWEIWRGADDGFASPACCLWIAHDPLYDRLYVINELYQSRLTAQEFARSVRQVDSIYEREEPIDGVLDSAAWADIGNGSRAEQMNALGCRWQPAEKGAGSRIGGLAAIHSKLAMREDGKPGLIIFNTCRHLIRTLPAATYATTGNPEDTDLTLDHALDALRYSLGRKKVFFYRARVKGV
ncbi:MAG: hypothetical protein QOH39_2766 [Verrucomicrobiota bacterium]|jgi:hypothetical protein